MRSLLKFPWKPFLAKIYRKAMECDIFSMSAQAAFYFTFSLFPMLFFLISLAGMVLETTDGLETEINAYLGQIMPISAFELVRKTVEEIVESSSASKLTFGLLVTLWSASAGIDGIRTALNSVYDLKEERWWWNRKLQSLIVTLLFILLTGFILSIVFYGWEMFGTFSASLGLELKSPLLLAIVQWISILLVMLFACEVIYNVLPDHKKRKWQWITPGTITAILLWLLLTNGFRVYLEYFNSYSRTYGSLGAMMILILWLYLAALVVIVGGAINAVYYSLDREPKKADAV